MHEHTETVLIKYSNTDSLTLLTIWDVDSLKIHTLITFSMYESTLLQHITITLHTMDQKLTLGHANKGHLQERQYQTFKA